MASPVNDLLQAVHARLSGDPALAALIGGNGVHDRRLGRTVMPYLAIGAIETRDRSTATEKGLECLLSIEAWSAAGRREAEEIASLVRMLLDDADLALTTATLVSLRHRRTTSRREAKTALFVAEMMFRAVME
ncbi:MAG: DUF3168 domain-containing protein [Rhizobium sp.]